MPESEILFWIVLLPAIGAVVLLALPGRGKGEWPRGIASLFTLATLLLASFAAQRTDWTQGELQLRSGVAPFAADGLSLPLVILIAAIGFVACWSSYGVRRPQREPAGTALWGWHVKAYFATLLFAVAMSLGVLVSQNAVWLAVFLISAVAAVYLLITHWGYQRREAAGRRFLFFWLVGATAFLAVLAAAGRDLAQIGGAASHGPAAWRFWLMLGGIAIMLPVVPLHRWLGDALAEASTPVAILVAAAVLGTSALTP